MFVFSFPLCVKSCFTFNPHYLCCCLRESWSWAPQSNERVWYSWTNPNANSVHNSAHYVSDNRYYPGRGMYIYMYVGIGLEGHLPDTGHHTLYCTFAVSLSSRDIL